MAPTKIKSDQITEGVCYSAPVFFEDGVNMFLAANHPAKKYHIIALNRWNVQFLVTSGKKIEGVPAQVNDSIQEIDASEFDTDIGELEAL